VGSLEAGPFAADRMSRTNNWCDNALIKSCFARINTELDIIENKNCHVAESNIGGYITCYTSKENTQR
jgi:hypothetical protein